MRLVEILVAVNALCGIAAFLLAKGLINRARRKAHDLLRDDDPKELDFDYFDKQDKERKQLERRT